MDEGFSSVDEDNNEDLKNYDADNDDEQDKDENSSVRKKSDLEFNAEDKKD